MWDPWPDIKRGTKSVNDRLLFLVITLRPGAALEDVILIVAREQMDVQGYSYGYKESRLKRRTTERTVIPSLCG